MTSTEYQEAIKEQGKFIILTDTNEVQKVFDTEREAEIYCSTRMKLTKNNKIDLYITTGKPVSVINGMIYRDDIKPRKTLHIGLNW